MRRLSSPRRVANPDLNPDPDPNPNPNPNPNPDPEQARHEAKLAPMPESMPATPPRGSSQSPEAMPAMPVMPLPRTAFRRAYLLCFGRLGIGLG